MEKKLNIRIGHLKIIDHLILGHTVFRLQSFDSPLHHSTLDPLPMNSWEQICEALRRGDLHGAFITAPLAMDLFAAGLDISFLMFVHRSGSLMVKNRRAGIKNLVDLKGKSVLIPHRLSVQHLLVDKLLTAAGLRPGGSPQTDSQRILVEPASPLLMPQMLENDQDHDIGAYMAPEPYGSQAVAMGMADRLCTSDSLWKDHPCCGFVVQKAFEASHGKALEELIRRFFQSARILDTQIQAQTLDTETLDFVQTFLGQEQEVASQALLKSGIRYSPEKLFLDRKKLDILQAYLTDTMGVLPQPIDLDDFLGPGPVKNEISETAS
jgi:NitT/TauT family transport system substrate-binding protein